MKVSKPAVPSLASVQGQNSILQRCKSLCLQGGGDIRKLIGPFSNVIDGVITDKFVRNWLDLLSFLLSGANHEVIV